MVHPAWGFTVQSFFITRDKICPESHYVGEEGPYAFMSRKRNKIALFKDQKELILYQCQGVLLLSSCSKQMRTAIVDNDFFVTIYHSLGREAFSSGYKANFNMLWVSPLARYISASLYTDPLVILDV